MHYVLQRTDTGGYRGGDGLWHSSVAEAMKWLDHGEADQCAAALTKEIGAPVQAVPA